MQGFYLYGCMLALVIGVIWISFGKSFVKLNIPFEHSGWLTPIWFLPAIIASFAQIQFESYHPGLILLMEALAALLSGMFGPLGWLSFHFGLWQGILTEIAFGIYQNIYFVIIALVIADFSLMRIHPKLSALKSHSEKKWILHFLGVLVSTLALTLLLNLKPSLAYGFDQECQEAFVTHRGKAVEQEILIIADFDGTIVDTDSALIHYVIPATLLGVHKKSGFQSPHPLLIFRKLILEKRITKLPNRYSLEAWQEWGFPVDELPQTFGVTAHERVVEFWKTMAKEFNPIFYDANALSFHRPFIEFRNWMRLKQEAHSYWSVLTSRTQEQSEVIPTYLNRLGVAHYPLGSVFHRGSKRGRDSSDNAHRKVSQIKEILSEWSGPVVFFENDAEILSQVQKEFGERVLVFQVTPRSIEVF